MKQVEVTHRESQVEGKAGIEKSLSASLFNWLTLCLPFVKKYPVDTGLIILFLLCAVLFAERPKAESENRGIGESGNRQKTAGTIQVVSPTLRLTDSPIRSFPPTHRFSDSPIQPYKSLAERNIFDPGGNYEKAKELKIIPENPYNLIAVLQGKENRAIFMDYTGSAMSFKVGDKMIDGAVVKSIGKLSVTVKKGNKLKEYRIFDVKPQTKK